MATSSSIKKLNPRLQPVFGKSHAGWEGTGLDLEWFPSGQIEISSYVEAGTDGNHCVAFIVSLHPTWVYGDFPLEPGFEIEAEVDADCQHEVYCGNMHRVYQLPSVNSTSPIEAVTALHNITAALIQLGKEKPIEYWLELAGESKP